LKKYLILLIIILNIIPLFYTGCVPSKPTEEVELLPSERLINRLEANRRRIKNFEGRGTIQIKSSQLNNSASFRVIVNKPDSIYLTILGPFGIELAQAIVTKEKFIFYDALQNTAYQGEVDQQILRNIFKIDLAFSDLMDAFVGAVNLTEKLYTPPSQYEVIYDQYILTYIDSVTNASTMYHVDVRELGINYFLIKNGIGKEILEGKYSNFSLLEGVAVPYKIEVTNKIEKQLITIDYRSMQANRNDIYIDFKIPNDAAVIKW
jgi:outer membrane lipoprotein-sorting protein